MTKTASRGKKAFSVHKAIEQNEKLRRVLLVKNIVALTEMFDNGYYKDILGDDEAQWSGYLAQLEIFYTRNQVHTYTTIYKKLTQELGINPDQWLEIPITRISECLPLLNKRNYKQWFSKANNLTTRDWRIEIAQATGKVNEEDEHKCEMVAYEICSLCGKKHKA